MNISRKREHHFLFSFLFDMIISNHQMRRDESREDYLEKILQLSFEKDFVRSIDIARAMNFSKPSVSIAMSKLSDEKFIVIDAKGHITLTQEGMAIATKVYEKHMKIAKLLVKLGVSEKVAYEDACKLEHDLSDETWSIIKKDIEKVIGKID